MFKKHVRSLAAFLTVGLIASAITFVLVDHSVAQEAPDEKKEKQPEGENPFAKAVSEADKPASEAHKLFESWQGYFDATFEVKNPGAKESFSFKVRGQRRLEKGGWFLNESRTASEDDEATKPNANHIYGYDAFSQEYFAFLYGEGTGTPFSYRGKYDPKKKALVLYGDWKILQDGKVTADVKERMEIDDFKDGKQEMRVYGWGLYLGKKYDEFLHLKITYTKDELEADPSKYARYATDALPSEGHIGLSALAGVWASETTITPMGMEPAKVKGTSVFKVKMEGRFVEETFEGDAAAKASPYYVEMRTTHGFDNARQTYQISTIRQGGWNTHIELWEGDYDEKAKAVVTYARYWDPVNDRWVNMKQIRHDIVRKVDKASDLERSKEGFEPSGSESFRVEGFFDFEGSKSFMPGWSIVYTRAFGPKSKDAEGEKKEADKKEE